MMPYLAQGATQAIEDATSLCAAIFYYDNLPEALDKYQKQRAPRSRYVAETRGYCKSGSIYTRVRLGT